MADNTIIQQGSFTQGSTATSKTIRLRSDVDWMRVYNETVADADQTDAVGVEYYWQRGMAEDRGIVYKKSNAANAANLTDFMASGGFTLVDTSASPNGQLNATVDSISNAAIPVVTNTGTNGLIAGDVVRLINVTGGQQLGGFDFTVGHNTLSSTTFSLDYMSQIVAATTGSWMKINFDPLYYPRHRYISKITQASQAVVTMTVKHGYKVGQQVRFVVPAAYGMTEMDGKLGTITAVDETLTTGNTITVDIDSTNFTSFAWPLTAETPFAAALVVPVGESTEQAVSSGLDIYGDATENEGLIGMILAAGENSPAGQASDVVYWVAGKSFSIDND